MKRETIAKQLGVGVASVRSRAGGGKAGVVSRRHEYFCPRDETDLTTAAAPAAPTPSRWGPFSPPWIGIQVRRGCYTNRTSLLGRAIRNGRQHSSQPENTPVKPRRALQRAVSKRAAPFGSPSRPRIGRFRRGASRRSGQAAIVFCMLLLRQRHDRDVLQDPQGRTRLAHHLPEPDRSRERNRQLHRRLLQRFISPLQFEGRAA
jgi:hypothetical protein